MNYFSQTCQGKVYYVCNYSKVSHKKALTKCSIVECNTYTYLVTYQFSFFMPYISITPINHWQRTENSIRWAENSIRW